MLRSGLVVGKHAKTVLHGEDLVVDATVVSVLVAQVVQTLTKLSDKLVLLGGSDLDTGCLSTHATVRLTVNGEVAAR